MADEKAKKTGNGLSLGMVLLKLRSLIAFLGVFIVFAFIAPNFLTVGSLITITGHQVEGRVIQIRLGQCGV